MTLQSALYSGTVVHNRLKPRRHRLQYRVFWLLLDLDEIDTLTERYRLFSRNRFNALSFHDADHGDGSAHPLRAQIDAHLENAGIDLDGGAVRLLCMPRILGYGFNPLSIYFCHHNSGELAAIVYQVHNTFGERHSYLIPVQTSANDALDQNCAKGFYVSPFLGMHMNYAFRIVPPTDRVSVRIEGSDEAGPMIVASLTGKRETISDASLLRAIVTHPLLTVKVIGAIHWHALRMWLKGFKLQEKPPAPAHPVTIVNSRSPAR